MVPSLVFLIPRAPPKRAISGGYDLDCGDGGGIPSPWRVGDTFSCTAYHTLTQADIDLGDVSSTTE